MTNLEKITAQVEILHKIAGKMLAARNDKEAVDAFQKIFSDTIEDWKKAKSEEEK